MKHRKYIDLHLHLDGSLSLKTVKELAKMQDIEIPKDDKELISILQVSEDCRNLNEYLEKFDFPLKLLQTKDAISKSVYNLICELKAQGLIYAEIRFAPQLHTQKGLTQIEVVEAAIEGMNKSDFKCTLILCCMRGDDNFKENKETINIANKYLGNGVGAIDIAGAEALYPTENFEELFELARNLKIPFTIHAGEADGPQSVYKALEFKAKRIGHGIRSVEDKELMKKLANESIVLELCPTSNLNTNIFESLEDYPIRELIESGIKVTINTDNITVSGTTIEKEFQNLINTFSLDEDEVNTLIKNSIEGAFTDEETKIQLMKEL